VGELEEDLEITEQKYTIAIQKYDKAATEADDSDRMAKVLANRATEDEAKMTTLAKELSEAQKRAEEADKCYEEAQKKMQTSEQALDVNGERADVSEYKIIELEEELKVVANNLKSLEVSEDKANQRESFYKNEIKRLTTKLKQSETRSEFAERSVVKLQKEVSGSSEQLCHITNCSSGGQAGGRAGQRTGQVQGDHRGAGRHICRDVWILSSLCLVGNRLHQAAMEAEIPSFYSF
jgi:uncharacterized protein (DUF3084 family)